MSNKSSTAEQINDQLREIASFSTEQNANLENEAIKGTVTSNKLTIEAAIQVAKHLKDLPWDEIPIALQNEALHHTTQIRTRIKSLADFTFPPNITPHDHVNRISNDLFQQRTETQNKPPLLFHSQQLASNTGLLLLSDKARSEVAVEAAKLKEKVVESRLPFSTKYSKCHHYWKRGEKQQEKLELKDTPRSSES